MIDSILRTRSWATNFSVVIVAIFVTIDALETAAALEPLDEQTRIELQMTLKDFIDDKTEDGIYPFFDIDAGEVKKLRLKSLHPVIFKRDGHYMMCADFLGGDGKDVLIDYIVVPDSRGYAVEQQILGRRSYLKTLFDRVF